MVHNFNTRRHPSIGNLRPIDVASKTKAVAIDYAVPNTEPPFSESKTNQEDFQNQSGTSLKIVKGSYVFISPPKVKRGFDVQVC